MKDNSKRIAVFESMPIKQAVLRQIMPAVASQMITLLYSLADSYFVGLLNSPVQTAAVAIVNAPFLIFAATANLFGIGGASALSRSLGEKRPDKASAISGVSFWWGVFVSVVISAAFLIFMNPILALCGAKADTLPASYAYSFWVYVLGGPFMALSMLLAHLVRAEGDAFHASFGLSMGCILNIILDPFFVLPQFLGLQAEGAGIATAISNFAATAYFLIYIPLEGQKSVLALSPKMLRHSKLYMAQILKIGFPAALQLVLTGVSVAVQLKFVSKYATEAVAALGIVKKIDQVPLYFVIGVSNGLLPMLAFNHAANNQTRRKQAFRFGVTLSVLFALLCLVIYELFAPTLTGIFIDEPVTIEYGASFLRLMVLAMPLMAFCYPAIVQFQAMDCVQESLFCSILRKGALDIPLLFLLDTVLPLFGCMLVQPIVDSISLVASLILYARLNRKLEKNT